VSGSGTTFLSSLSPATQRTLTERGTVRRFARGAALGHAGQLPSRVLVILKGHVKLTRLTEEGRDVLLAIRGAGELVGEQSALDGQPRSASIVALDAVEALALPPSDFVSLVSSDPEAAMYVMRLLARRLREADGKRVEFTAHDVVGRLSVRLLELCERWGVPVEDGVRIDLPLTQEDLAGWVGASREATSRGLQQMRALGWVTTARRCLTCHDLDALRRRAEA
jgi:CRP/FNR family transcriptional regulator, cyclic AMP receptor protein